MALRDVTLDELTIDDHRTFETIGLYRRLTRHLKDSSYRFRVADRSDAMTWDRALFLNLTFWSPREGADVLCEDRIAADVVAHIAWHSIVNAKLALGNPDEAPAATALFFAESVASAFDLYLLGRLLGNAPDSDFITSQLPIMTEVAQHAGLSDDRIAALVEDIHDDPERAFEDMRALLFDVSVGLFRCRGPQEALDVFGRCSAHRFAPFLHHFEISNWILFAHARAKPDTAQDDRVNGFDSALRREPCSLDWLAQHWVPAAE